MAVPFDNATTFLTTLSNMARTQYAQMFPKMFGRFGSQTNKIFKFKKRALNGPTFRVQCMVAGMDNARWTRDLNADFGQGRAYEAAYYDVTVSEDPSTNDLGRCSVSLQVTYWDIKRNYTSDVAAADYMKNLLTEATRDTAEKMAMHHHLDATALLATINGTPKKNDNVLLASCASIAATGGARFAVDNGRIGYLKRGTRIDVYNGVNKLAISPLYVTDYNPKDQSVGVYGIDANGNPSSTIDLQTLADNYNIYLSGEYNKGPKLLGNWFTEPASSGDSFFGKDRADPLNRWLRPHFSGPTSVTPMTRTYLDDLAREMQEYWEDSDDSGYVLLTSQLQGQRLRNEIQNDVTVIKTPSDAEKGKVLAEYGFDGYMFRHPSFGRIMPVEDVFAPPDKARLLRPSDWELSYVSGAEAGGVDSPLTWMSGDGGQNYWYRMESSTPGNGRTTTFKMDGVLSACGVCYAPKRQAQISNLSVT